MGPNGAGKSTLFHLISGMETPDSGNIYFKEKEITSIATHEISRFGLGRTFQTLQSLGKHDGRRKRLDRNAYKNKRRTSLLWILASLGEEVKMRL